MINLIYHKLILLIDSIDSKDNRLRYDIVLLVIVVTRGTNKNILVFIYKVHTYFEYSNAYIVIFNGCCLSP